MTIQRETKNWKLNTPLICQLNGALKQLLFYVSSHVNKLLACETSKKGLTKKYKNICKAFIYIDENAFSQWNVAVIQIDIEIYQHRIEWNVPESIQSTRITQRYYASLASSFSEYKNGMQTDSREI